MFTSAMMMAILTHPLQVATALVALYFAGRSLFVGERRAKAQARRLSEAA